MGRGQGSKLNGNAIVCHPGDPLTSLKNPTIIQLVSHEAQGFWSFFVFFIDHNVSFFSQTFSFCEKYGPEGVLYVEI